MEKSFCYVYKIASPCTTFQGSVQSHLLCTWSQCPCPCSLPDWARARCLLSPRFYPLCRPWPAGECWGSILWPLLSRALGISQHQTQVVLKLWFFCHPSQSGRVSAAAHTAYAENWCWCWYDHFSGVVLQPSKKATLKARCRETSAVLFAQSLCCNFLISIPQSLTKEKCVLCNT